MLKLRSALVEELLLHQADTIDYRVLAAATHEAHNIPAGAKYLLVHTDLDCYLKLGSTSFAVPAADITDGTGPVYVRAGVPRLIDLQAQIAAATPAIGLVAAGTPKVALEWFS